MSAQQPMRRGVVPEMRRDRFSPPAQRAPVEVAPEIQSFLDGGKTAETWSPTPAADRARPTRDVSRDAYRGMAEDLGIADPCRPPTPVVHVEQRAVNWRLARVLVDSGATTSVYVGWLLSVPSPGWYQWFLRVCADEATPTGETITPVYVQLLQPSADGGGQTISLLQSTAARDEIAYLVPDETNAHVFTGQGVAYFNGEVSIFVSATRPAAGTNSLVVMGEFGVVEMDSVDGGAVRAHAVVTM